MSLTYNVVFYGVIPSDYGVIEKIVEEVLRTGRYARFMACLGGCACAALVQDRLNARFGNSVCVLCLGESSSTPVALDPKVCSDKFSREIGFADLVFVQPGSFYTARYTSADDYFNKTFKTFYSAAKCFVPLLKADGRFVNCISPLVVAKFQANKYRLQKMLVSSRLNEDLLMTLVNRYSEAARSRTYDVDGWSADYMVMAQVFTHACVLMISKSRSSLLGGTAAQVRSTETGNGNLLVYSVVAPILPHLVSSPADSAECAAAIAHTITSQYAHPDKINGYLMLGHHSVPITANLQDLTALMKYPDRIDWTINYTDSIVNPLTAEDASDYSSIAPGLLHSLSGRSGSMSSTSTNRAIKQAANSIHSGDQDSLNPSTLNPSTSNQSTVNVSTVNVSTAIMNQPTVNQSTVSQSTVNQSTVSQSTVNQSTVNVSTATSNISGSSSQLVRDSVTLGGSTAVGGSVTLSGYGTRGANEKELVSETTKLTETEITNEDSQSKFNRGSQAVGGPADYRGSVHNSLQGSLQGSVHNSVQGSVHNSVQGSAHHSVQGSAHHSVQGSVHHSVQGSVNNSVQGSVHHSVQGSVHNSVQGSVNHSVQGSVHHSVQGSVHHSVQGSVHDSVQGSVHHSVQGSVHHSVQGSVHNSVQGSVHNSVQGSVQQRPVTGSSTKPTDPVGSVHSDRQSLQSGVGFSVHSLHSGPHEGPVNSHSQHQQHALDKEQDLNGQRLWAKTMEQHAIEEQTPPRDAQEQRTIQQTTIKKEQGISQTYLQSSQENRSSVLDESRASSSQTNRAISPLSPAVMPAQPPIPAQPIAADPVASYRAMTTTTATTTTTTSRQMPISKTGHPPLMRIVSTHTTTPSEIRSRAVSPSPLASGAARIAPSRQFVSGSQDGGRPTQGYSQSPVGSQPHSQSQVFSENQGFTQNYSVSRSQVNDCVEQTSSVQQFMSGSHDGGRPTQGYSQSPVGSQPHSQSQVISENQGLTQDYPIPRSQVNASVEQTSSVQQLHGIPSISSTQQNLETYHETSAGKTIMGQSTSSQTSGGQKATTYQQYTTDSRQYGSGPKVVSREILSGDYFQREISQRQIAQQSREISGSPPKATAYISTQIETVSPRNEVSRTVDVEHREMQSIDGLNRQAAEHDRWAEYAQQKSEDAKDTGLLQADVIPPGSVPEEYAGLVYKGILFNRPAEGRPTTENFRLEMAGAVPYGLDENEVLLKLEWVSVDPYMRERMNEGSQIMFQLNKPCMGHCIGRVLASNNSKYQVGDYVQDMLAWTEFVVAVPSQAAIRINSEVRQTTPVDYFISVFGLAGLAAYVGYLATEVRPGQTLVVNSAYGAVGQIVAQMAKADGVNVVVVAGGTEKCGKLRELGFDRVIDYKTCNDYQSYFNTLHSIAPDGLDAVFENVGGYQLDTHFKLLNPKSKIVFCGAVSQYNLPPDQRYHYLNLESLILKAGSLLGLGLGSMDLDYAAFTQKMTDLLTSNQLVYQTDVVEGSIEVIPEAFIRMLEGANFGKQSVKITRSA